MPFYQLLCPPLRHLETPIGVSSLYIIEKLKSFFVDTCRLQMESESRDFWQGDGLVAWHYNCHFRFLI